MQENTTNEYIAKIKKLSVKERIQVVEELWDSIIESDEVIPISDEHKEELDKRLESFYREPNKGKLWNELKDNLT